MEDKIYQILKKHRLPLKKREEILADLFLLLGGVERSEQLKAFNCVNFEDEHGICKAQCDYCKRVKGF